MGIIYRSWYQYGNSHCKEGWLKDLQIRILVNVYNNLDVNSIVATSLLEESYLIAILK